MTTEIIKENEEIVDVGSITLTQRKIPVGTEEEIRYNKYNR